MLKKMISRRSPARRRWLELRSKNVFFIVAAALILLSASTLKGETKKKLLFIAPTFNIEGLGFSIDGIKQIGENLIRVVQKKTGLSVDYEMIGSANDLQSEAMKKTVDRLKKGGDFSWMDYRHYSEARKAGVPVRPAAILTVNGEVSQKMCLYVLKDSKYKKLADLRKKKLTGGHQLDWVSLRGVLFENKIDERPDAFFKDLVPVKTYKASLSGTISGFIDTFMLPEAVFNVVKVSVPGSEKFAPLACTKSIHPSIFPVYRDTVPADELKKIKSILLSAHSDPDMGVVATLMKSTGIYFVEPTPEIMARFEKEYQTAVKRGWFDEGEKYTEMVKSMEKKNAGMKKCRAECEKKTGNEAQKTCREQCAAKFK